MVLISTFICRLVLIFAITSFLSVADMTILSSRSGVAFALSNNDHENMELHNAASPAEGNATLVKADISVLKTKDTKVSTIALRSDRHENYMRVILEGPHKIISSGKVRRKDNVVSVMFSDAHFSLKEKKLAVPYRRELNRILFTQFNLEKIRTHNLLKPSRLAIDFYIDKIAPDQLKASDTEKDHAKKTVVAEKPRPVTHSSEKKMTDQMQALPETENIPVVEAEAPESPINPNITGGESIHTSDVEVHQAEPEKFQTISKKEEQKTVKNKEAEPDEKAPAHVMVAAVKTETVPVNVNDAVDSTSLQSVPDVAVSEMQIKPGMGKIAILPFDNLSNNNDAPGTIMPLIVARLEDRGYDVLDYEEIEAYLCEKKIRQSTFLSAEAARDLGRNRMVHTVMAGAVLTFASEGNPKVGIMARLLDSATGQITWSDFVSLTGEDFTGILGLGTITSVEQLVPRAVDRLFADFGIASPKSSDKELYKIAVLPFKNQSTERHAGKIITHLFQHELANNPMFDPVDFGEIRQTIVNLRIGSKGEVDYNNLEALSKSLGVDIVLTGTVEEYGSGKSLSLPPSVTISARLLDSRRNRILWYDNLHLDGNENIIALDWGRLRSADKVAYGAVSDLVKNMGTKGLLQ